MMISKEQIELFIPQRAPFVMIDNLVKATTKEYVSDFRVLENNLFLEGHSLSPYGLIENISQTAAAGIAYLGRQSNSSPADGYIGGITKLKLNGLPGINDLIETRVLPLHQLDQLYMLKGENYVNGRKLMECVIKLAGFDPEYGKSPPA